MPDFSKALRQLWPRESPQRQLFQSESPVSSIGRQLAFLKSRSPHQVGEVARLDGFEEVTRLGRHLVIRSVYGEDHYHGTVRIGRFSCADLQRFLSVMKQKATVAERDAIVFLDTETTGIQGGTGMVPFLVGLGYFEGEDFQMVQYFI